MDWRKKGLGGAECRNVAGEASDRAAYFNGLDGCPPSWPGDYIGRSFAGTTRSQLLIERLPTRTFG